MAPKITSHPEFDCRYPERFDWSWAARFDVMDCAMWIKDRIKQQLDRPTPRLPGLRAALCVIAEHEEMRESVPYSF